MTTTPDAEPLEGELVPVDDDRKPASFNLFGSDDPDVVVAEAAKVARSLEQVIRQEGLFVTIRGKDHVKVEGWTLLGAMLGVFPVTVWTRKLDDGWEARVEARTLDGRLVGAAESMCSRSESRWRSADEYAIRSMAATRATSKALRQTLGFIMHLAHFAETPAEEMYGVDEPRAESKPHDKIPAEAQPTKEQKVELKRLLTDLHEAEPGIDWAEKAREIAGVPSSDYVTATIASRVIDGLYAELARLCDEPEKAA
jgi:hypothetical protein